MYAGAESFFFDLANQISRHFYTQLPGQALDALGLALFSGLGQAVNHRLRHRNAWDILIHKPGHTGGLQGNDSRHNGDMDLRPVHSLQKPLQAVQVKNALGLDVFGASLHLLAELIDLQRHRLVHRGHGSTLKEDGCATRNGIPPAVCAGFLHLGEHLENAYRVQIIYRLALFAIAHHRVIAGESQHGIDAEGCGGENVRHERHPAAVPSCHLQNRLDPHLL